MPPSGPRPPWFERRCPAALFLALVACSADDLGGECATDDDCSGPGASCLVDVKAEVDGSPRFESYCTTTGCGGDSDCPAYQSCVSGRLDGVETRACVDRVRRCGATDPANGLDDDCDGVIDPAGAPLVTSCLEDEACGAFVCRAPPGQAETVCAPREPSASTRDFQPCQSPSDCANGLCTGLCSPTCRPGAVGACPSLVLDGVERSTVCARGVDGEDRPPHNLCQVDCTTSGCPSGTACVWRDTAASGDERRFFVCSVLDPARSPLGATCRSNSLEDDLSCQHGLCFDLRCTRRCGGPGSSCADVGPDFVCRETQLFYGTLMFENFICVRSGS